MKKVIVASVLGLALNVASSFGQGYITMQSYDYVNGTTPVYSAVTYGSGPNAGKNVGAANGWVADLLYSQTGGAGTFNVVSNSQTAFFGTSHDGGSPTTDGAGIFEGGNLVIAPYVAGATAFFQVEAYNGGMGSSYGGSGVTYEGLSAVFSIANLQTSQLLNSGDLLNLGGSQAFPPTSTTVTGLQPFTVAATSVPEPSILALSGIGAAALMLIRRKK